MGTALTRGRVLSRGVARVSWDCPGQVSIARATIGETGAIRTRSEAENRAGALNSVVHEIK
ncbi:hypothetical protein GCM10027400_12860 [Pseudoxanthomonas daejeonensis]